MATDPKQRSVFSENALCMSPPSLRFITQRVQAVNGVNLGQGTCQVPAPDIVLESASVAMRESINGYTLSKGLLSLRSAIAKKLSRHNGVAGVDPETEVIVTAGATGALDGLCGAFINPGDEVVLFEPYYPYHRKTFEKYQADIRYVPLRKPDWSIDEVELKKAITSRTKFVMINTPLNPCGKVFTREEILIIGRLCKQQGAFLITDEIYEYILFGGKKHISPASIEELRPITFMIGGYSKTFAITGWRIGFLLVPPEYSEKISQVLDLTYVCAPAPLQEGVARAIEALPDDFYHAMKDSYSDKRDFFVAALEERGLKVSAPAGSYYILADYSDRFSQMQPMEFVLHMIETAHVAAVPSVDFVNDTASHKWARFCFAVTDEVLQQAAKNLSRL